jgi:hypothetical protein
MRIHLIKPTQKEFLKKILQETNCPSLRELKNRGFEISYSNLKNFNSERRLLPQEFFENLCKIANIKKENLKFEIIKENWGQSKGGKKSKK